MKSPSYSAVIGRILLLIVAALLLLDGIVQLQLPPFLAEEMDRLGFPPGANRLIALLTLSCGATLAIPATAPFGTVLATGFLGGAICTHFRIGEIGSPPQIFCGIVGLAMWWGLLLADERLRPLLRLQGDHMGNARYPL